MNPNLDPRFFPLFLTALTLLGIPHCYCQDDQQYQACWQTFQCGGIKEIGYPFSAGDRPALCGRSGFELSCQDEVTRLNISSQCYRVLSIDHSTRTLIVSRDDLWGTLCPRLLFNTTIDSSPFNSHSSSNDQSITLYYGCTPSQPPTETPPYQFECDVNDTNSWSFFYLTTEVLGLENVSTCSDRIFVRVNQTAARFLETPVTASTNLLQGALRSGFSIQWSGDNGECCTCVQSGGLCGQNPHSDSDSFASYCADRDYSSTCDDSRTGNGNGKALEKGNRPLETDENLLVVCFGEMLIDFVPTTSGLSLAEAPAFKKAPGGAPANVAVGIARLSGSSAFIGKVGADEFGYMLADILKENNVNSEGMRFDPGARTALAFVTLRKDGEREFMFYRNPSADMLLREDELDLELIKKAKIFHYGSISLITEPCKSAHIAAAKAAKDAGVILSYDPNLRLPLWPSAESAREGILSIWDTADIIKISEDEVRFLTQGEGPYDDNVVRKLYHQNLKLLLVTEGPKGCRYYTKEFSGRVKGLKVEPVDTTGAGDAFVAGFLSQLASDISLLRDEGRLREALRFANACGALTVTERGGIPALPSQETVMNALFKSVA